jgi:hypothetical protein
MRAAAIVVGLVLLLAGCTERGESDSSTVAEADSTSISPSTSALEQYEADVDPLLERVRTLQANYGGVQGDNFTTDRKMLKVVSRDVPEWSELAQQVAAIETRDPDIDAGHGLLVEAVSLEASAMAFVASALETKDSNEIDRANYELAQASAAYAAYRDAMEEIRA